MRYCLIYEIYRRVKQRKLGGIFKVSLVPTQAQSNAKDGSHLSVSEIVSKA